MNEIVNIELLRNFQIRLKFKDGFESTVDIAPYIGKGFTVELLNEEKFQEVRIGTGGGLEWPNGFDICPNFLREQSEKLQNVA